MKKISSTFLLLSCFALLIACGNKENTVKTQPPPQPNPEANNNKTKENPKPKENTPTVNLTIDLTQNKVGDISTNTTIQQLTEIYGEANVKSETMESELAGGKVSTTTIFANTDKELVVNWEGDFKKILSIDLYQGSTAWSTTEGIKIGSTIDETQQANGKAFKFMDFYGAEGSGFVMSWEGGKLSSKFNPRFMGNLPDPMNTDLQKDKEIMSNIKALSVMDPTIDYISIYFGE